MLDVKFSLDNIAEIGQQVAQILEIKSPLLLYGQMGSGKTTLSKHIIKALGCNDEVTSPTFNIMQSYSVENTTLWHIDLYRLDNPNNIQELGLDELNYQSLLIIEWPERLEYIFKPHLKGTLEVLDNNQRHLIVEKINE